VTVPPRPPYELEFRQIILAYAADESRLRRRVPSRFSLREVAGQHYLQVVISHFTRWRSIREERDYGPYYEIAYHTPVWHKRYEGLYFFRLEVSETGPMEAGREYFGYPKRLADVRFEKVRDDIWCQARERLGWNAYGRLLMRMSMRRRLSLADGVQGLVTAESFRHIPFFRQGLLLREKQAIRARWDFSLQDASPCDVLDVEMPWLERKGLLRPGEGQYPAVSLYVGQGSMRLGSGTEM